MFTMTYTAKSDDKYINVTVDIVNEDTTLEQMFANFMSMMHKIGYQDGSWDAVMDNVKEWRDECGDSWVTEYITELS